MMRFFLIVLIASLLVACSVSPGATKTTTQTSVAEMSTPRSRRATLAPLTSSPTQPSIETPTLPPTETETQTPTYLPDFPAPASAVWKPVIAGLDRPVGITHAGDGSGRLFIIEQAGHIHIFKDGALLSTPFLDIQEHVGSRGNEQGLLGLAFSPRYSENGLFFAHYTDLQGNTVIARFERSGSDPDRADPDSETKILTIEQPFPNHNGGMLAFGPDGFLYIGLGDGGSGGDPFGNGQALNTLLGKILRIDVNSTDPYTSPTDNLFADGQRSEIWAYGLRNPWRFSFDRLTGDLYIGDVGQNQWEEIDFLPAGSPAGSNFGWAYFEGMQPYYEEALPAGLALVFPIAQYSHANGCSVTGGVVYRGKNLPEWYGLYLYGDYCYGSIWGLYRDDQGIWQNQLIFENVGNISSFGEDESGEIYLADLNGIIYRLEKP